MTAVLFSTALHIRVADAAVVTLFGHPAVVHTVVHTVV